MGPVWDWLVLRGRFLKGGSRGFYCVFQDGTEFQKNGKSQSQWTVIVQIQSKTRRWPEGNLGDNVRQLDVGVGVGICWKSRLSRYRSGT